MISTLYLIINLVIFALVGIAGVLVLRSIGRRVSKKLSVRLIGLYTVVLLLSPILAGFIVEEVERKEPVDVPEYYYEQVFENYEERNLEDLQQDEYLRQLTVSEIPVDMESFSEDSPLWIASSDHGELYTYHLIIEVTDTVDQVVITQFVQRFFVDSIDISKQFIPWSWSIADKKLQAKVPEVKINLYSLSPTKIAFHFDGSLSEILQEQQTLGQSFGPAPREGMIQWIQIPEELEFYYRGRGPWRIKQ